MGRSNFEGEKETRFFLGCVYTSGTRDIITLLTRRREVPSHPITTTKLIPIPTVILFTLFTILTLINPTNPYCTSKMTTLACFRRRSPPNQHDDAVRANALYHGLLLAISLHY